jgi:hypothetical protein
VIKNIMQPLNKWKRRILLIALLLLFVILTPWILMNSFGYRLDDALNVVKTGGLYLHSEVPNTSVYINGKYIKDNGALIRNVFIQKLKPNSSYKIEVYKDGFNGWVKELYVYPGIVSEGHVLMLPEEFEIREIYPFFNEEGEGVYSPVPGFTKVSRTLDGRIIPENGEYINVITLFEGENPYEPKVPEVVESENILNEEVEQELPDHYLELGIEDPELLDNLIETSDEISWLQNGDIVLYWIDKLESIPYYYCGGIEERICNEEIILDWQNEIKRFAYYPGRSDAWIVLVNDGIYAVEVDPRSQRNIQTIYLGQGLDFRLDGSGNLIIKDQGSYFEIDL